ncbi:MAG: hypothetical protein ACK4PI_01820 [Tepidisphaerales bacterium]
MARHRGDEPAAGDSADEVARRLAAMTGGGIGPDPAGGPPGGWPNPPGASVRPSESPGASRPRPQPKPVALSGDVGPGSASVSAVAGQPGSAEVGTRAGRRLPTVAGAASVSVPWQVRSSTPMSLRVLETAVVPTAVLGGLLLLTGVVSLGAGERLVVGELPWWLGATAIAGGAALVATALAAARWLVRLR